MVARSAVAARVRARVVDLLALVTVFVAMVLPDRPGRLDPWAFVALPVELVLGAAVLLVLPRTLSPKIGTALGFLLGVLTVMKVADLGFYTALARPFDPVLDVDLLDDAIRLLTTTRSPAGGVVVVIGVGVAVLSVVAAATLSVRRLALILTRSPGLPIPVVTVATVGWLTVWLSGVQIVPGLPLASSDDSRSAQHRLVGVAEGLADHGRFEREAAVDNYAAEPGDRLLTSLRGKDVVIAVVESYGRSALDDQRMASALDPVLDDGSRRLASAGFQSRSAYLTSSTAGGGSWLAHATLLSGLWIDNQQRFRNLVASDRLTLTGAFARAGWRTVAVAPGTTQAWPEGSFYGFQAVYDVARLGYDGPSFSWSPMPDQYALARFQQHERRPGHSPVMAVVEMTSSHAPWAPVPTMIDWSTADTGSSYASMGGQEFPPEVILTSDPDLVRADYARAVGYSLTTVISYLQTYGDEDLVMVIVGDHQPSPVVTGDQAGRDVPVTIVTKDPAVLARVSGWGWTDGLRPGRDAEVWRMDAFRDRFLSGFGPATGAERRPR